MTPAAWESSVALPSQNMQSIREKNPSAGYFHEHQQTRSTDAALMVLPALQQDGELQNALLRTGRVHRWKRTGNTPNKHCPINLKLCSVWLDLCLVRRRALNHVFPKKAEGSEGTPVFKQPQKGKETHSKNMHQSWAVLLNTLTPTSSLKPYSCLIDVSNHSS